MYSFEINEPKAVTFICTICNTTIDYNQISLNLKSKINTVKKDGMKTGIFFISNGFDVELCNACIRNLYNIE